MDFLRKWQTLSERERWLAIEAVAFLLWARVIFALLPVPIAFRLIGQKSRACPVAGTAEEVRMAVTRAAHYAPFKAVCLQRAFAAFLMLRRRGLPATVHFGVRRQGDTSLVAHAWSMSAGTSVTGTSMAEEFVPIAIFGV
jgi:Transglutaminase-like superfamily